MRRRDVRTKRVRPRIEPANRLPCPVLSMHVAPVTLPSGRYLLSEAADGVACDATPPRSLRRARNRSRLLCDVRADGFGDLRGRRLAAEVPGMQPRVGGDALHRVHPHAPPGPLAPLYHP